MKNVDVVPQSESQGEIEHEAAAEELEEQNRKEFVELATRHYTALRKIKDGEFYHAERICKCTGSRKSEIVLGMTPQH